MKGFFELPCNATGKNLKWSWKFNGGPLPYGVKSEGNMLVGQYLLGMAQSGKYQCFVEDTVNNVKTFSREIEIKVTGETSLSSFDKHFLKACVNAVQLILRSSTKRSSRGTFINSLTLSLPIVPLTDFTLSNARRFYSSMGNPTGLKGLSQPFLE